MLAGGAASRTPALPRADLPCRFALPHADRMPALLCLLCVLRLGLVGPAHIA
jgi:hypothetical protein